MKSISKWVSALAATVLLAGTASSAEVVSAGKVKAVNADKKQFVLTDAEGKDSTYKLGDNVVINRGGKESKSDLKAGDTVNVCYDKGLVSSTAHYILVQEAASQHWELMYCTFKGYDVDKKQLSFTDAAGNNLTSELGTAKVRLNAEAAKVEDMRIGDRALLIVEKTKGKTALRSVLVERK